MMFIDDDIDDDDVDDDDDDIYRRWFKLPKSIETPIWGFEQKTRRILASWTWQYTA